MVRRATEGDAADLANIIYIASHAQYSRSSFEFSFGGGEDSILETLRQLVVTKARSVFHYSHFNVFEMGGVVVSGAAGFDEAAHYWMVPALLEIGWTDERIDEMRTRLRPLTEARLPNSPGAWIVDNVSGYAAHRSVGKKLVSAVLARGRDLGYEIAEADVFQHDYRAIGIHGCSGFLDECHHSADVMRKFLDRDPMIRMWTYCNIGKIFSTKCTLPN